ncbi:unnamed protein product [Rotaria sp. Silwood1]|nr:unnamed protein product [Rotaria sp. Silwood1]
MSINSIGQCTQLLFLVTILLICIVFVAAQDYYQILGVERNASDREIKRQFHKLALKYHPDKNNDPKAEITFRSITEAYNVLSDINKRRLF